MDFSIWIQSPSFWLMCFSALLIGMSKAGIQGITLLSVPLMAMAFGAKASTGVILPMLCFADVMSVIYYRRVAEWRYIFRLLPAALLGFGVALFVDHWVPPAEFRRLMGGCLLAVLAVMLWTQWKGKENTLSSHWWYGPLFGLLGGFTTMIGNAAGPVMAIYLLSVKMPKGYFIGTNAWFFLVVNFLKLPVQIWVWNNITLSTLMLNACAVPFILLGGVLGIWWVKKLSESGFRHFTTAVTCISVLMMLL